MPASSADQIEALGQAGLRALQAGDPHTARRRFLDIVDAGRADADVWLAIAVCCQRLGDQEQEHQAVDRALALDPRNLRALLVKADCLSREGERRAAAAYRRTAIAMVPDVAALPSHVAAEVRRAQQAIAEHDAGLHDFVRAQMESAGFSEATSSARFAEALDLLVGKRTRYVQQPRTFFFPGLPTIEFYPRDAFDWMDAIEAATDDICSELQAVRSEGGAFAPYIHAEDNRPVDAAHPLLDNPEWSAFFLWRDGRLEEQNAARSPKTMAALAHAPLEHVAGRGPMALFSELRPGAAIAPHTGFLNTRLICHLGLVCPDGCTLRVGNERREWSRGKAFAFDDSIEHEARNQSAQTRIVLIFSIWRPELSEEERHLVSALLQSVDQFDQRG